MGHGGTCRLRDSSPFFSSACKNDAAHLASAQKRDFLARSAHLPLFPSGRILSEPSRTYSVTSARGDALHSAPSMKFHAVYTTFSRSPLRLPVAAIPAPSRDSPPAPEDLPHAAAHLRGTRFPSLSRQPKSLPAPKRPYRCPGSRQALLPRRQIFQRLHVRARQVVNVNVVANARPIRPSDNPTQTPATPDQVPAAARSASGIKWVSGSCSSPISPLSSAPAALK